MIDVKALQNLSYGVYAVTANDFGKYVGLIANSVMQVTSNPMSIIVSLNHANYTTGVILKNKRFIVNVLGVNVDPLVIGTLGFNSSNNMNKFDKIDCDLAYDIPVIKDAVSYLVCEVVNTFETSTHMLFLANVIDAKVKSNEEVMTYAYYHMVRKGLSPKNAPTYVGDVKNETNLKETIKEVNEKDISKEEKNMKYKCLVCGQIIDNPEKCPVCGAEQEKIVPYKEEELTWADEHTVGVAKGVDEIVLSGLRDHFKGECSEVGMYLAMARQAEREGYPEIAVVLEKIAHEEAEHAAKFAEMLGELVSNSTKANLEKMLAGENGACKSKKEIATRAKQLNYDAIHDSVHEMTKDEARHGKALEALLKRYFK